MMGDILQYDGWETVNAMAEHLTLMQIDVEAQNPEDVIPDQVAYHFPPRMT